MNPHEQKEVEIPMTYSTVDTLSDNTYLALDHLGVGPLPLSLLVFPRVLGEVLALDLQRGVKPPTNCEPRFVGLVADGQLDSAIQELRNLEPEPWVKYNLSVLTGESLPDAEQTYHKELLILNELASFTRGETDALSPRIFEALKQEQVPALRALCGFSLLAHATESDDLDLRLEVLNELNELIDEPMTPLSALIQRTVLAYYRDLKLTPQEAVAGYREAINVLEKTDLTQDVGSLYLELASVFHELAATNPGYIQEAVRCYQSATRYFSKESDPEIFGSIQIDLAVCFLAMPMSGASDALRYAVAISSLREASKIFKKDTYPRQWLTTQLNLASALIYAPSSHTLENLVEAIAIYSDLVGSVDMKQNPMGYAHLMFNWGNALSHLGDFKEARSRLHEARRVFEEFQSYDDVRTVRDLLDEIERHTVREVADGAVRADTDG